jgi:DNA-binding GntR family transcriptional regulator
MPGTKLPEQKLANHFGVSRTLVRQALFQASQNRLINSSPRAAPLWPRLGEARQVFAVRRMLEAEMVRNLPRSRHLPLVGAQAACGCREEGHGSQ